MEALRGMAICGQYCWMRETGREMAWKFPALCCVGTSPNVFDFGVRYIDSLNKNDAEYGSLYHQYLAQLPRHGECALLLLSGRYYVARFYSVQVTARRQLHLPPPARDALSTLTVALALRMRHSSSLLLPIRAHLLQPSQRAWMLPGTHCRGASVAVPTGDIRTQPPVRR